MTYYNLEFFWLDEISTSNSSGFDNNGGFQFNLGTDTVTISNAAATDTVVVDDDDPYFDDDDFAQTIPYDQWIDGVYVPAGTTLESEYELFVRGPDGKIYTIQFISVDQDAFHIYGFSILGEMPPFGVPLVVVGRSDGVSGVHMYETTTAACFAAGTRIATPGGPVAVETLRPGDAVSLASGGTAPVALVLRQTVRPGAEGEGLPIRLQKDALGPGKPANRLILSPQHRVLVEALGGLVACKALTDLPRIGPLPGAGEVTYVHLVLARHAVLLAEGLPCESFWPGSEAMKALTPPDRAQVTAIMGPAPCPARPFIPVQQARRRILAELLAPLNS